MELAAGLWKGAALAVPLSVTEIAALAAEAERE